jgi:hypothetical protein
MPMPSLAQIRLPGELRSPTDVHVSQKYRHLADRHTATVDAWFTRDDNCTVTHDGVRREIVDLAFVRPDIESIAAGYQAQIRELSIYRLETTPRASDRGCALPSGEGWVSELWHSDNYPAGNFKILVYLTDVGEQQAPFEHRVPVRYRPRRRGLSWQETREASDGASRTITGPAGTTIIFNNNIVHKGNYCREGHRDILMVGLTIPGRLRRSWSGLRAGMVQ